MEDPWSYVEAVVAGDILACSYLRKQCKKLLHEYKIKQHEDDYPWFYHEGRANHFVEFTKHCRYPDGLIAGKPVSLHPWQLFTFSMAYGWRSKADISKPRYTDVYTRVARKNDKSTGITSIMLYELLTGPDGHEQYITAVDKNQANICFRKAVAVAERLPDELSQHLRPKYGNLVNVTTGAFLTSRSRENKASDGLSCYRGYWDESARIEDEESFDILHSSQGAWQGKHQNWYISTAQANRETRYYQDMEVGRNMLDGLTEIPDHLDRKLYAFYELDDEKEWDNPDTWFKANPSMGLSTTQEFLEERLHEAKVSPAKKSEFLRKYCNIYTASESPWINVDTWDALKADELEKIGPCYIGLDMGKTSDINGVTLLWVNPKGFYEVDFISFLPQEAVKDAPKHTINIYRRAIESGVLKLTPGRVIDTDVIKESIKELYKVYDVKEVVFDPYKDRQMMTELENYDNLPMVEHRQGRVSMAAGTSETERIIKSGLIKHLGNPFISWQIGNCQVDVDIHDLQHITKPQDYSQKIDNIVAMIMCISRATVHGGLSGGTPSVYII